MLSKKSPREGCGIGKRNNRIEKSGSENQRCALAPDLESILRGRMRKFLFRQHRPKAVNRNEIRSPGYSAAAMAAHAVRDRVRDTRGGSDLQSRRQTVWHRAQGTAAG